MFEDTESVQCYLWRSSRCWHPNSRPRHLPVTVT